VDAGDNFEQAENNRENFLAAKRFLNSRYERHDEWS